MSAPVIRLALAALPLVLAGCVMEGREAPARPGFYQSLAAPNAVVDGPMARDMIGAYRRNKGLGLLVLDPDLQAAAEAEARAMAEADKPRSADALKASLAQGGLRDPGANLSAGYHTLPEAFSGWRESPVHDRVLLDPRAARMGIATAYAPGSKYKVYWALVTAGPP